MNPRQRVLAVGSAGGHWTQLMRLRPAFAGCDLVLVSTLPVDVGYEGTRWYRVPDGNKDQKLHLVAMATRMLYIILRERPDIVVTTGAAPGYFAIRLAKIFGARTVWLDSMANVDKLSLSGEMSLRYADVCLTQWPHLARPTGPHFVGTVV